ncbi:MAG: orotate phosphoribosyltransferase [Coriobacteriales bacterium]|jgi:orotate phosphoribosyltransferase|nr:orotate phosphoribosyltransferase [Coriobacteriales bacterium]
MSEAFERMTDEDVLQALKGTEAIRQGHFRLTSGRHSDTYVQCARVLEHPRLTNRLAAEAAARLPKGLAIDLVASPAIGGILFGFAVAAALDVPFVFSERTDGEMAFRRSFEVPPGARVLVAEDVVTTGGSVQEVCRLVAAQGGEPAAVLTLIDRGSAPAFPVPYYPLLRLEVPSWAPEDCVLCQQGIALSAPGSRKLALP